jgi:hypothetical protein
MKMLPLRFGRRARRLVPAFAVRGAMVAPLPQQADDVRMFWMTLLGGLVFFGTYIG